jgi:hypothetical protein
MFAAIIRRAPTLMRRLSLEIRECANVTLLKTRESNEVFALKRFGNHWHITREISVFVSNLLNKSVLINSSHRMAESALPSGSEGRAFPVYFQ